MFATATNYIDPSLSRDSKPSLTTSESDDNKTPSPIPDELEQISLETQGTADSSTTNVSSSPSLVSTGNGEDGGDISSDEQQQQQPIKCSAIHALERDMPDYDYSHLVRELREKILKNIEENPGLYAQKEVEKCKQDDWFLTRFLLRHKMDVELALDQLKRMMRYHHESLFANIKPEDFPSEFYQLGGTFSYPEDRKGNKMMYMRVKVHRKTPEIKSVVEGFLYYNLIRTDELANGRGIACVMDCTGGGLQSADLDTLFFFVSSLKNYFPRGLSYILVHNIPWILKPFWHLAKAWVSEEHRELIKFSNERTVFEYIDKENLPDFMGGTCPIDYRQPPPNCVDLAQACKLWGVEKKTVTSILNKFKENLPAATVERLEREYLRNDDADDQPANGSFSKEFDGKPMIAQVD